MKLKFKILIFATLLIGGILGGSLSMHANDNTGTSISPTTRSTPSETFLQRSKKTMAMDIQGTISTLSPLSTPRSGWGFDSGQPETGWLPGGNVGSSPIGDITIPMILSFILLFFVYRGVTINKRKNL